MTRQGFVRRGENQRTISSAAKPDAPVNRSIILINASMTLATAMPGAQTPDITIHGGIELPPAKEAGGGVVARRRALTRLSTIVRAGRSTP
jgi:hypothetical protein